MGKFFLIVLILIAAAAAVAYFRPDLADQARSLIDQDSATTTVYKWRDENGQLQVTSQPPPPGVEFVEQEYLHGTNVLPTPTESSPD